MQDPAYNHPAAPPRAIPLGEEPLVTRAKVCAQLRAALQVLEGGPFDRASIEAAQVQLQGVQRVLFVAKAIQTHPGLPAFVRLGSRAREAQA